MQPLIHGSLIAVVLGTVSFGMLEAQVIPPAAYDPCGTCAQPFQTCTCTTYRPVVETRYRAEKCLTYRDVVKTGCRQEACTETVPVTTVHNVTRDEGCYKMVWCPKPVTRQVPQTTWQQRVRYRTVPYQTVHKVPQVTTRLVPQQTVRYVPGETHTFVKPASCAAPLGCAGHAGHGGLPLSSQLPPVTPAPVTHRPVVQSAPVQPRVARPVPDPRFLEPSQSATTTPWTEVPVRRTEPGSDEAPRGGFEVSPVRSGPPAEAGQGAAAGPSVRAPSAATVWQTTR